MWPCSLHGSRQMSFISDSFPFFPTAGTGGRSAWGDQLPSGFGVEGTGILFSPFTVSLTLDESPSLRIVSAFGNENKSYCPGLLWIKWDNIYINWLAYDKLWSSQMGLNVGYNLNNLNQYRRGPRKVWAQGPELLWKEEEWGGNRDDEGQRKYNDCFESKILF